MPKPTGYGTRPHALTFHIYNPITLIVLEYEYRLITTLSPSFGWEATRAYVRVYHNRRDNMCRIEFDTCRLVRTQIGGSVSQWPSPPALPPPSSLE